MNKFICVICKNIFYGYGDRKYCSKKCHGVFLNKQIGKNTPNWKGGDITIVCNNCGKKVKIDHNKVKTKYCSRKCSAIKHSGINNHNWTGGKHKNKDGYILHIAPNHPYRVNNRYVFEHRLVMEKYLGRYLKPKERIHHVNNIKDDNRIENLKLFSDDSKHKYHEWSNKEYRKNRFHRPDIKKEDILPFVNKGLSYRKIAKIFETSHTIISRRIHY